MAIPKERGKDLTGICLIGALEARNMKSGEAIFEEIMTEKFPKGSKHIKFVKLY